jgi:hypothetical protein
MTILVFVLWHGIFLHALATCSSRHASLDQLDSGHIRRPLRLPARLIGRLRGGSDVMQTNLRGASDVMQTNLPDTLNEQQRP